MKLSDAVNDLITRINEILDQEEYSDHMLTRVYRIKDDIIAPATRRLKSRPKLAAASEVLTALYAALEEYVVCYPGEPDRREERRKKVEGLKVSVRRTFLPRQDREGDVESLLDDIRKWQWKTNLDENGRLVYATGSGAKVPARGAIAERVGAQVIEQACKAQRPYSDKIRPRNIQGEPGGLIKIDEGSRAIIVGDLHGRYDNLENILKDKNNLASILSGDAHLIFTGDAIHPPSSSIDSPEAYEDSFCVMLLIMTLKAENPFNIHYLIGNHDAAHVGGMPAGRGQVRQDIRFEESVKEQFGEGVFEHYREFTYNSPVAIKLRGGDEYVMLVHAGLSERIRNEQDLIDIYVKGRQSRELEDLLWSRNYERATLETCLANVGAKFIIAGHTSPTQEKAERYGLTVLGEGVFAHVHNLQVIMCAQRDTFGYVDFDMTQPLPECVSELRAPDGRRAFRMLRPKRRRAKKKAPPPAS